MECWRWYPGYEGIAQVSTRGQVKTVDRLVTRKDGRKCLWKGRILKPRRDKNGYLLITLSRNGKERTFKVHRMVAETWIDNPENKPEVNHRNEQKDMNFVENLSWASRKANVRWGTGIERSAASRLNGSCSKPVEAIDPKTGEVVLEFPSTKEAGRNGFDSSRISKCCRGKTLSHKGFVWRYKDDYGQEKTWTPVKIGREAKIASSLSKTVQAIDPKSGEVMMEFASTRDAQRNGFNSTSISFCCRGIRLRTHHGYIWRYKP